MLSSKVSGSIGLSNRNEANSLESYLPHDRSHSKPKSIQSPFQHTRPHPLTSACASLNERQIGFGIETLKTNETEIWMLILTEKSETQTWICLFLTSWKSLHLRINDSTSTVSKKTPAALLASPIYSQGITRWLPTSGPPMLPPRSTRQDSEERIEKSCLSVGHNCFS